MQRFLESNFTSNVGIWKTINSNQFYYPRLELRNPSARKRQLRKVFGQSLWSRWQTDDKRLIQDLKSCHFRSISCYAVAAHIHNRTSALIRDIIESNTLFFCVLCWQDGSHFSLSFFILSLLFYEEKNKHKAAWSRNVHPWFGYRLDGPSISQKSFFS